MPIGLDDGTVYKDEFSYTAARLPGIDIRSVENVPTTDGTMPPGASTEPADALKPSGGTETPEKVAGQDYIYPTPDYMNPPERETPFPRPRLTEMLKGFYDVAKNASSLTQAPEWGVDPKTGEVHTSTQAIEKAADLAGLMTFGPAPVASKMAEGTLGSFAGVRSRVFYSNTPESAAMKEKFHTAVNMEMDTAHPDKIWEKTGFFRGADNKWRYEIPDVGMKLKDEAFELKGNNIVPKGPSQKPLPDNASFEDIFDHLASFGKRKGLTLEQVIDHPELFKAYPELKGVKVQPFPHPTSSLGMATSNREIYLNQMSPKQMREVLMHEVQHMIQDIERFAKGGSAEMFQPHGWDKAMSLYKGAVSWLGKELGEKGITKEETLRYGRAIDAESWGMKGSLIEKDIAEAKEKGVYQQLKNIAKAEDLIQMEKIRQFKEYEKLMGEVESRNVEARINFGEMARKVFSPMYTEEKIMPRVTQIKTPYPELRANAMSEPIPFRRAANENFPEGHPNRPYNPREPNMIGSDAQDKAIDESWRKAVLRSVQVSKINKQIDDLMKQYPHSEFDKARLKKLKQDRLDIEG